MMIRVNKSTGTKPQHVKYAALSTGTISAVWYDEEAAGPKRQNHIKLIRAKADAINADRFDA
jgi:hypothetical protein